MRDPCPHCGLKGMSFHSLDRDGNRVIDTKDHNCPAFAVPEPLSIIPTDTTFIREAWNTQDALAAWRKGIRSGPPDDCECRICTEEKAWQVTART